MSEIIYLDENDRLSKFLVKYYNYNFGDFVKVKKEKNNKLSLFESTEDEYDSYLEKLELNEMKKAGFNSKDDFDKYVKEIRHKVNRKYEQKNCH